MTVRNQLKSAAEITSMRTGGRMLATVLRHLVAQLAAGMTTADLAQLAREELARLGGKPAFLGYQGFPDVICISVNEEVVHGIPGVRVLEQGDLVGLDFGVLYEGLITDGAVTVGVGSITAPAARLLTETSRALESGVAAARVGARVGDISHAVEQILRAAGLGVIQDLIGHGVGHQLHEEPGVPNYGSAGQGQKLQAGMTLAIEPMATLGDYRIKVADDGWTVATADGSLSAQFEHTVLVGEDGGQILTAV